MEPDYDIPADRNKTNITHAVTEAAAKWMASIGAKCMETEVPVANKWVADLACFWRPTPTEATNQKLIPRALRYPYGSKIKGMEEYIKREEQRHLSYQQLPEIITILVEVKTTRPDFNKEYSPDGKFNSKRMADIQILAVPRQLLKIVNAPDGWWIIECGESEGKIVKVNRFGISPVDIDQRLHLVSAVGERRHNRTANLMWSQLSKRRCSCSEKTTSP